MVHTPATKRSLGAETPMLCHAQTRKTPLHFHVVCIRKYIKRPKTVVGTETDSNLKRQRTSAAAQFALNVPLR